MGPGVMADSFYYYSIISGEILTFWVFENIILEAYVFSLIGEVLTSERYKLFIGLFSIFLLLLFGVLAELGELKSYSDDGTDMVDLTPFPWLNCSLGEYCILSYITDFFALLEFPLVLLGLVLAGKFSRFCLEDNLLSVDKELSFDF